MKGAINPQPITDRQELMAAACAIQRQYLEGKLSMDAAAERLVAITPAEACFTMVDARDFLRVKPRLQEKPVDPETGG